MKLGLKTFLIVSISNLLIISAIGWILVQNNAIKISSQIDVVEKVLTEHSEGNDLHADALDSIEVNSIIKELKSINSGNIKGIILLIILSILISSSIGFIHILDITKYLQKMVNIFEFVKKGNYRQRLNITRKDEIGELSRAIDMMMSSIQLETKHLVEKQNELIELNKQYSNEIITRRQSEEELKDNRYRLKKILNTVQTGILLVNKKTLLIEDLNKSAAEIIGKNEQQLLNTNCMGFCDTPGGICPLKNDIEYYESRSCTLTKADQSNVHILKKVIPIILNNEEYYLESILDITTLTNIEEKNRVLQDSLLQSQKMEAIGLLAGGVAHDFNNILTIISGNSQLIKMDIKPDDPSYELINEIENAGERAQTLTRQLLAFSRKQILQPIVLNINEIILDMSKMLKRLIGEQIELKNNLNKDISTIRADKGQLEQVIMNLVVNARDAMPDGGSITIETSTHLVEKTIPAKFSSIEPGHYIRVDVLDTGVGMNSKTLKKIFEPFFTTKAQGKGTGLGLSTVFGIIQQSKGTIFAKSKPGNGTQFTFLLPEYSLTGVENTEIKSENIELLGNEKVLIVEDDSFVSKFIVRTLARFGYETRTAVNGLEALDILNTKKENFDLIITDIVMPELNGYKLIKRVREKGIIAKVLFMSGYANDSGIPISEITETEHFINKPFKSLELVKKVRAVFDEKDATD